MTAVVFETPGLIDVRAFTIMGAHAKPNSANPIGYFGTGAKYAIAVLVRLGADLTIWIGRDKFTFAKRTSTFRGVPLETITMAVLKDGQRRASKFELPYTTAYGKNWEAWQAFRELESNTRDEGGRTYLIEKQEWQGVHAYIVPKDVGKTLMVVDGCPEFLEAAEKIDEIFLPRARREGLLLDVIEKESDRLYYRTMRVLDLAKPTVFTYNLLEKLELTEDRTLKGEYYAKQVVARWVLTAATTDQVERILKVDKDAWEYGLEFPGHVAPSPAFEEVMKNRRKGVSRNAWSYYGGYSSRRERTIEAPWSLSTEHPRPWRVEGLEVIDKNGEAVFAAPEGYYDDWERTAEAVVARINLIGRIARPAPSALAPAIEADVPETVNAETF